MASCMQEDDQDLHQNNRSQLGLFSNGKFLNPTNIYQ